MYIQVLASGSKGNVIYLQFKDQRFLIDVGLSYKQLKTLALEHGIDLHTLSAVFITHEHTDHVKGLRTFHNKHPQIPIVLSVGTFQGLKSEVKEKVENIHYIEASEIRQLDGLCKVEAFALSHDANEPLGYIFYYEDIKVVVLTDTGYVSGSVKERIKGADVYVFEFNHDPELLMHSHYPWHIKQRILSNKGHLSNADAAYIIEEVIDVNTHHVLFAHMSESNNLKELVEDVVVKLIDQPHVTFEFAYQHIPTSRIKL